MTHNADGEGSKAGVVSTPMMVQLKAPAEVSDTFGGTVLERHKDCYKIKEIRFN